MAKDPAFLFYPSDWIGGTMGMTFEEKGAYMELLMLQFHRGHMTTHMIGQVLGQKSGQLWDTLKYKFEIDEDGRYFNKRLEEEQEKRKAFTASRKNNIKGGNQYTRKENNESSYDQTHDHHMTNHMVIVNENINITSSNEKIGVTEERKTKPEKPGWKTDFRIYQEECTEAFNQLINDPEFMTERQKYHPRVNIQLTIEKAFKDFWSTEAGWKNKKSARVNQIDWKRTFINAIDQKFNHVYADNTIQRTADQSKTAPGAYKRNNASNNRSELESLRDLSIAVLQSDVPQGHE